MAGRFTKYRSTLLPRTGRMIRENGDAWSEAEWGYLQERYSLLNETINNGAAVLSIRATVNTSPYYIGIDVPEGRNVVLFNRDLEITEGDFDINAISAADGFTGGDLGLKSTLKVGAPATVQANIYSGVTPAGAVTERYHELIDTGTGIGGARSGGISGIDDVIQVFAGQPMLRITRLSADPYRVVVRLIVWEQDA